MKKITQTTLRRLAIAVPLLALITWVMVFFRKPGAMNPQCVVRNSGGKYTTREEARPAPAALASKTVTSATPAARAAKVPSHLPLPAPASLDSSTPQPGHFAGVTVINAPAPPPEILPPGTPRTPLVWKPITTPSGKRLLVAKPDATWQAPFTAKNAGR